MKLINYLRCVVAGTALFALMSMASAQEILKVSSAERGAWESAVPELGQRAGIFKKHGIVLDLLYTEGDDETLQRVISGSVEVGLGIGTMDVLRAYVRGTPVRIIGTNVTGASNYWYVLTNSPIQRIKDLVGKTIAYATNGSSSHYDALDFSKEFRLKARLVSTGGTAETFKELTANHIDLGWAAPPFGIDEIEQGKIRIIARANDVPRIRDKTLCVLITNVGALERRKDALARFMQAYRETVDWMYSDPAALKHYAEYAGVSEGFAKRLGGEFFWRDMLTPDKITGLQVAMKDARARLSRRQVSELIQIPAPLRDASTGWSSWRGLFSR
jgi:ABC-type nitrate/sulfonate/bicarbonate transport system substrate-binding protein